MLQTTETIEKEFNSASNQVQWSEEEDQRLRLRPLHQRKDAINAMNALNGKVVDGSPIEVTPWPWTKTVMFVTPDWRTRRISAADRLTPPTLWDSRFSPPGADPSAAYLGTSSSGHAPDPCCHTRPFRFPAAKAHVGGRGLIRRRLSESLCAVLWRKPSPRTSTPCRRLLGRSEGAHDASCAIAAARLLSSLPGYTLASPASSAVAQLKQAVSLGQDLTAYTTHEGYPAFAVWSHGRIRMLSRTAVCDEEKHL
ncbi:APOBEC1 complementation factor [Lates japonicus]|uniref:APOBEC1 complementation factor n=1 Tax=Lates japonicus TaxID=270547 RepID=A0AAD3NF61_LATJO|nr:APOBEC1 complementation factor [Lates japonicus]